MKVYWVELASHHELDAVCKRRRDFILYTPFGIFRSDIWLYCSEFIRESCFADDLFHTGTEGEKLHRSIYYCSAILAPTIACERCAAVRTVSGVIAHVFLHP